MIVYLDSSVLARTYLPDEDGHAEALALLERSDVARITGTWTRIEVSGALMRAARARRVDKDVVLALLDAELGDDGRVSVVSASQHEVEALALRLVREHAIRAMDSWHLATALLVLPTLTEPGEELGFASRDDAQAMVAERLGMRRT